MDSATVDSLVSGANTVVRLTGTAASVAAGELAKQAQAIGQLANAKDPIAWIAGEEADDDDAALDLEADQLEPLVPVPLAAIRPWSVSWNGPVSDSSFLPDPHLSASSGFGGSGYPDSEAHSSPPFQVNYDLNAKVYIWEGDMCCLEVDALVAPTAAGYTSGASTVFPKISRYGGKDLRSELRHVDSCRSGEARACKAFGLPCRWLLLTVGPKYKDKYHVAAENTLNSCYREAMQLLVESELRSVAIPCNWYTKGYPPEEQAHVALRTVRRCLENLHEKIDSVVIVPASAQEAEMYESLMPLYFPRNSLEVNNGAEVLPQSCFNKWGEVTVEERKIVISALISSQDDDDESDMRTDKERQPIFSPNEEDDRCFLDAKGDSDDTARKRLEGTMIEAENIETMRAACLRYLRRARDMRAEPESSRFVYSAGKDQFQRNVVVLLGARLPSLGVRDERCLPLFVKELEDLRGEKFVLLYVNSGVPAMDTVCLEVLQEMLAVIGAKYRTALEQLIVLHPGFCFRAAFAMGQAVNEVQNMVWNETVYAESFDLLSRYLPVERLRLPEYVRAADLG